MIEKKDNTFLLHLNHISELPYFPGVIDSGFCELVYCLGFLISTRENEYGIVIETVAECLNICSEFYTILNCGIPCEHLFFNLFSKILANVSVFMENKLINKVK